jgi:hypothetical protein
MGWGGHWVGTALLSMVCFTIFCVWLMVSSFGCVGPESIPKVCVVGHSYGSFIASKLNMAYR